MKKNIIHVATIGAEQIRIGSRIYNVLGYFYTEDSKKKKTYNKAKIFIERLPGGTPFGVNWPLRLSAYTKCEIIVNGVGKRLITEEEVASRINEEYPKPIPRLS